MKYQTLIVYLMLSLIGNHAIAETFYVRPAGDHDNRLRDGKSHATAWATIAEVNSYNFKEGDDVYFLAGGTWNLKDEPRDLYNTLDQCKKNKLFIDWKGNKDNRTIVGAYYIKNGEVIHGVPAGTAKPTIIGSYKQKCPLSPENNPGTCIGKDDDPDNKAFPPKFHTPLVAIAADHVTVKNLRVQNSAGRGIVVINPTLDPAKNPRWKGCPSINNNRVNEDGVVVNKGYSYAIIENNEVVYTAAHSTVFSGKSSNNILRNNDLSFCAMAWKNTEKVQIIKDEDGNERENWPFCNGARSSKYNIFEGNTIHKSYGEGIDLLVNSNYNIIRNNTLAGIRPVNIYIDASSNNIVENNLLIGDKDGEFAQRERDGIKTSPFYGGGISVRVERYGKNIETWGDRSAINNIIRNNLLVRTRGLEMGIQDPVHPIAPNDPEKEKKELDTRKIGAKFLNNTLVQTKGYINLYENIEYYDKTEIANNIFYGNLNESDACNILKEMTDTGKITIHHNHWDTAQAKAGCYDQHDKINDTDLRLYRTEWDDVATNNENNERVFNIPDATDFKVMPGSSSIDAADPQTETVFTEDKFGQAKILIGNCPLDLTEASQDYYCNPRSSLPGQSDMGAITATPVFTWTESWQVVDFESLKTIKEGEKTRNEPSLETKAAFGASAEDWQIKDIGATGDTGSATAALKAFAHHPGGDRQHAQARQDVETYRHFRLLDSKFGWKVFLEGNSQAWIHVGPERKISAEVGAWAGIVDSECSDLLLELDIGEKTGLTGVTNVGNGPCTPSTFLSDRHVNRIARVEQIDFTRPSKRQPKSKPISTKANDESILPDGEYMVIARNAARAASDNLQNHSSGEANFFDPDNKDHGFKVTFSAVPVADPDILRNVEVYFRKLGTELKATAKGCAQGYNRTHTVRIKYENTSTDTTLSGLALKVKGLNKEQILCNADTVAGQNNYIVVAPSGEYADGLLGPGESFYQTIEIGLNTHRSSFDDVDLLGFIAIDETAPSLIQSSFGPDKNNLEVVVRENGRLQHYFREFDDKQDRFVWKKDSRSFALGVTSAPSLIQSSFGPDNNNLEVVVRENMGLQHYFREFDIKKGFVWKEGNGPFAPGAASAPSLIESSLRRTGKTFEAVVLERDGRLHHYYRKFNKKDDAFEFIKDGEPFALGANSAPSLIEGFDHNGKNRLEVVVRKEDGKLHHYVRKFNKVWEMKGEPFAKNVTSAPVLILNDNGNLEVVVRQADNRLHHYFKRFKGNKWIPGGKLPPKNVTSAPAMIQSSFGADRDNLEVVVRQDGKIRHYFREFDANNNKNVWDFGDNVTK